MRERKKTNSDLRSGMMKKMRSERKRATRMMVSLKKPKRKRGPFVDKPSSVRD